MAESLIELLKPHEEVNIAFQQYLMRVTNGRGNFVDFANNLSWRMQLGMIIEFLDVVYDITISIFPNGGAVIKTINGRRIIGDVYIVKDSMHPLTRYYNTIAVAFKYITKPF